MRVARWLVGVACTVFAGWLLTLAVVLFYGRRASAATADAVVVLGAAQYNGRPSPVLRARLDHAAELFRTRRAHLVITTGGVGRGDTVSEATVARRYLLRRGLPARYVVAEPAGTRTAESMVAVAARMRDRELKTALLVSDPFHMLRLKLLALHLGIRGYPAPTPMSPIRVGSAEGRRQLLRESFRVPVTLVFGPAAKREPAVLSR